MKSLSEDFVRICVLWGLLFTPHLASSPLEASVRFGMTDSLLSKIALRALDRLTDIAPQAVPRQFNRVFLTTFGSKKLSNLYFARSKKRVRHIALPEKILVVSDLNIGDSVLLQSAVNMMMLRYPGVPIHYLCNQVGGELFRGMPGVTVQNLFQGFKGWPTREDYSKLKSLLGREKYSLILNFGPFLNKRSLPKRQTLHLIGPFALFVLHALKTGESTHVSQLLSQFLAALFGVDQSSNKVSIGAGNVSYVTGDAREIASDFFRKKSLTVGSGIVFLNPDATSAYGQIPRALQVDLLLGLAKNQNVSAILIGSAYTDKGIENDLILAVPSHLRPKLLIVPHVPIDAYAAIIDSCDVFISGDGGPLHLAATRKVSASGHPMRNQTSIVTVHGATDSRLYGYDSERPNHIRANQDVPSRSFVAEAPCRNITCVNKWGKHCGEIRCFTGLQSSDILPYIEERLRTLHDRRNVTTITYDKTLESTSSEWKDSDHVSERTYYPIPLLND